MEDELLLKLNKDYDQAFNYQRRRHDDWLENYTLSRGKITLNRLTQRQSVSIPLMKETIKTWESNIDDAPSIEFEAKGEALKPDEVVQKEEREIVLNEYWNEFYRVQKIALKDKVDKRQVGLYGRSFKKLNVIDGKPTVDIIDPQDMLIDRQVDPTDLDTARVVIHAHIYRTLSELEDNDKYDQDVITEMKAQYATEAGLIKSAENLKAKVAQIDRMREMGVPDMDNPELGEIYIEVNEHYRKIDGEIRLIVRSSEFILLNETLEEIIGVTKDHYWQEHYPFSTWADDLESDFWSDSLADVVRPINKVLNSWFSQLIENRTLRNFGMNYYDATNPAFVPQTFEAVPWGWYPVPGNPKDIVQRIDIPDLSDSLLEMDFLTKVAERATSVTAIEKGVSEKSQITLGEVEILANKAQQRSLSVAKFYVPSWQDFAYRWYKFIEGQKGNLVPVLLSKKSWTDGKVYTKNVEPSDWDSEGGFEVKVVSPSEQEAKTMDSIQKFTAVIGQMQGNVPLMEIYQKKLLGLINLNPEEIRAVMEYQKQIAMSGREQNPSANQGVESPAPQPVMNMPNGNR